MCTFDSDLSIFSSSYHLLDAESALKSSNTVPVYTLGVDLGRLEQTLSWHLQVKVTNTEWICLLQVENVRRLVISSRWCQSKVL